MPIDLEMILSASPPIFSSSPFMEFGFRHFHPSNNISSAFENFENDMRSGLVDPRHGGGGDGKKHVWFADDKGLALTHVRVMSEPSNCPPRWTDEFLAQVVKGVKPPTPEVQWTVQFAQPASDYMAFRDKLQRKCVSLENVIEREGEDTITGTIKVKNLAFDKEVFLRATFDKWSSSQDIQAAFVPSGIEGGSSQYDTFSFSMAVPPSAAKFGTIEFCVCYRCSGTEYWDNNEGENYKLSAISPKSQSPQTPFTKKVNDTLQVSINTWSEFASWNHLLTEGPYW